MNYLKSFLPSDKSARRRLFEILAVLLCTVLLILVSRLESRLFELSENLSANKDFFVSVVYFGLININVLLILILSFLIFRNTAKLLLERRRGILGSKLKTKLVLTLVVFALAPTAVMFFVANRYITTSFDTWFSVRVRDTMQQTRDAGALVYRQDQKRLEGLAKIASERVSVIAPDIYYPGILATPAKDSLNNFDSEYGVYGVFLYNRSGGLVWASRVEEGFGDIGISNNSDFVYEAFEKLSFNKQLKTYGSVSGEEKTDVVYGAAPILDPKSHEVIGLVVVEEHFEAQILRSIETIIAEFANIRPAAQLIRLSFTILLVLLVLIILFTATWLGFYVAKAITGPIQNLAEATREVALGNYAVSLQPRSDDETGQLIRSFNSMTQDLQEHKKHADLFQEQMVNANLELERRRRYMEVVLKNISAGVISVDDEGIITSFNASAENLLGISSEIAVGKSIKSVLGTDIYNDFWQTILQKSKLTNHFEGHSEIRVDQRELSILFDITRIFDDNNKSLGYIFVFDDASEQAKIQKVAAWREVARRIAHEIKNPITPIMLSAQRLQRKFGSIFKGDDADVFNSCCDLILNQVDSLKNMVNEFSKFSRLPTTQLVPIRIDEIISELARSYAFSYPDIIFDTRSVNTNIPMIAGDLDQIRRALMNLINNSVEAMQFSKVGNMVSFACVYHKELNAVRISVCDNGPGINDIEKEKVLNAYYSTKANGTGLGLNIVQQIVSDHGGYLRMVDNKPRGVVFNIDFPALAENHTKV